MSFDFSTTDNWTLDPNLSDEIARKKMKKANQTPRSPPNIVWKHFWPVSETRGALSESPFLITPTELIVHIFQSLSVHDLENVSLVCRSFKMIADQDEIWKSKCNTPTKLHSISFKQIYMDWLYEKYLRNEELEEVEALYHGTRTYMGCGLMPYRSPLFPVRPEGKHRFVPIGGFHQHPNSSDSITIELSVDIDRTARELLTLLEKASKFQTEWRQPVVVKQMITRYYRFMQLKASSPQNILLVPTLDIEVVWQTHLLRPKMYRNDCFRLFRRVIDHSLLTSDIQQFLKGQAFVDTCQLYEQRFGEQYCPLPSIEEKEKPAPKYIHYHSAALECLIPIYSYWDETNFEFSSKIHADYENPFSFAEADIILDGNWLGLCKRFMFDMLSKVSIQNYYMRDLDRIDLYPPAIGRLKKSYERFLYMAAKYPPTNGYAFVHPTYAIDIIWHSHMQEPLKYSGDCISLVGYVIDHAPWPSVDEKKMKISCDDRSNSWKQEFESDMSTDHLYNTINTNCDYLFD